MSRVKRFVVFVGYSFYPSGGWNDFCESFDTAEEARAYRKTLEDVNWSQVIDLETGEVVPR